MIESIGYNTTSLLKESSAGLISKRDGHNAQNVIYEGKLCFSDCLSVIPLKSIVWKFRIIKKTVQSCFSKIFNAILMADILLRLFILNRTLGFGSGGTEEEMVDSMLSSSSSSAESDLGVYYEPSNAALQKDLLLNLDVNVTSFQDVVDLWNNNTNFTLFLLSLVCAISWIVYITFYSSRVTGVVLTKIANRFVKNGCVKIGKF